MLLFMWCNSVFCGCSLEIFRRFLGDRVAGGRPGSLIDCEGDGSTESSECE